MLRWYARLRLAIRSAVLGRRVEDELDEELRYHLEREVEEARISGLAPDEARYAALRAMGPIAKSLDECRDLRPTKLVSDFLADLRYAARAFGRHPGFAALVIGIMALGIGANTAVFSVVNAVLLKPLPYPGAERIVALATWEAARGEINPLVSIANYQDWRDQSSSFEAMASYRGGEYPATASTTAEYTRTAVVDLGFFRVFGIEPVLGRTFVAEEMTPDGRVALISHAYWQSRFAGDKGVLNRTIRVGNDSYAIVGVLPATFRFPQQTDLWLPQAIRNISRTRHNLFAVARLKPDVRLEQAQADLTTIAARLGQLYPDSNKDRSVRATPLQDLLVGGVRRTLYVLWGVVGIVLVIACVNSATLLLGRASTRAREVAIRTALGASRYRVIRQMIAESLLLAVVAGAAGILLSAWGVRVLTVLTPVDAIRNADTGIDAAALMFTLAVSVATSVVFGVVPAIYASTVDLADAIKQGSMRSMLPGRTIRTRGALVVSEIALAVVLLTGAGLLIKTLAALHNTQLGFQPENALVARATGVLTRAENDAFFSAFIARTATLPGVIAVGATSTPPGDLSNSGDGSYFIDRLPEQRDRATEPRALYTVVSPNTFKALGVPLRSGRDFDERDTADSPLVAIVNEALVRRSISDGNPIGRTIVCSFDRKEPMTIIGVVGDVRQRTPAAAPDPECYMPYTQHTYNNSTLNIVIRTTSDPTALADTVRRVAAEIAPQIPVAFTTMEGVLSKRLETPRFRAVLVGLFAALALCLATAGVYGVMAFSVQQRAREIGLRIALGASRQAVLQLVLGRGLALAALGLAVGLALATAASRLLATMLFEVEPIDGLVYLGVIILLGVITLLAGYLPARRAASLDPLQVLRTE